MSIRLRLTVWYTGVLCATLVVFSILLYVFLAQYLSQQVDETIALRAGKVADGIVVQRSFLGWPRQVILPEIDELAVPANLYIQVVDVDKNVVARSENLGRHALPLPPRPAGEEKPPVSNYRTVRVGGTGLRIYDLPLVLDGRTIGTVQVAESLLHLETTLRRLRLLLALGVAATTIVAGGVGWLMARTALRPIDRIARTAQSIGQSRNLTQRLEVTGRHDEVARLSSTFNEMLEQLEKAFATQRRFIADASHELRTPLTAIRGNLDLLRRVPGMAAGEREEVIGDLSREAERMSRLVADLLTLARADGGVSPRREPVRIGGIAAEAVREVRSMAGPAEIDLVAEGDPLVLGDPDRLRQLLLILLDNATKHGGGSNVEVSVSGDGAWVKVGVRDHGPGIGPEDLPHIFDRFYRASAARSRNDGGAGLGLAIAKWIAESHGGRIGVESTPGRGSAFYFALPEVETGPPRGA